MKSSLGRGNSAPRASSDDLLAVGSLGRIVKFNYDSVDEEFLSVIMTENSRRLSRTHRGVSDTSTSRMKRPLLLSGDALAGRAGENEVRVHQSIFRGRHDPLPQSEAAWA